MGHKRGGLAGLWDRNKQIIKPAVEFIAGMTPLGPLGSAGAGALMNGLDRPGKSGIGFDAGAGLRGGAQGYAIGSLGAGAKTGLGRLLGGGQAATATTPALPGMTMGTGGIPIADPAFSSIQNAAAPVADGMAAGATGAADAAPQTFLGKLGSSVAKNPTAYAMGLQGLGSLATSGAQNKQLAEEGRLTAAQADKIEYENKRQQASDDTLRELRARLAQQMMQLQGQGAAPTKYAGYYP